MFKLKGRKKIGDNIKVEVERKFIIREFPDDILFVVEASLVHQSYLCINPDIRVRSTIYEDGTSSYTQTIKGNGSLTRQEIEFDITEESFDKIIKFIGLKPIEKEVKKYIMEDGLILEASLVDSGVCYAEIEFDSEKAAKKWKPSEELSKYIISEVTDNDEHKLKNYWAKTRCNSTGAGC